MTEYKNYARRYKKFWNEVSSDNMAHIRLNARAVTGLHTVWKAEFTDRIDWSWKTVIDFGIGQGYLGEYLFNEYNLKKYVGIDISQRILDIAREHLKKYENLQQEFSIYPADFKKFHADVFVSLACPEHFPNSLFLEKFLTNLNNSSVKIIVLNIRHADATIFNQDNVDSACRTNCQDLLKQLKQYAVTYASEINKSNNYQYLIFRRNE